MHDASSSKLFSRTTLLVLGALFALIWFMQLNLRHLIPSDEGRYAEIAREMLMSGDWITPRYNGYLYFEKPPLQTWFNAATFAWFGIGDWQARLYTALCGFAGVLLAGLTGARVFGARAGFFAALALASAPYWNLLGHFNVLDMGLAFWMQAALCALLLAQRPGLAATATRYWMWLCWAAIALAVLSKGLVGAILPAAVLVLYTLITRDWALWKRLHLLTGSVIFAALTVPWFVLVQQKNPAFFEFFFIVQQFRRYLTPEQNRPGPFYYFAPVLILGFLPWLSILWQSLRHALKTPPQSNGFSPVKLLLVWSVFIFVFFSVSHSKLISYILPIAPALALLLGHYLPLIGPTQWRRHLLGQTIVVSAGYVGALVLAYMGDTPAENTLYRSYQSWVYLALTTALIGIALSAWINQRKHPAATLRALCVYAGGWFIAIMIAGNAHEIFGKIRSGAPLVSAVQAELAKLPAHTPFYSVMALDHTMPFYLRRTMIMVQHQDELRFGIEQEPEKWVPTLELWMQRWQQDQYALALVPVRLYETLVARGVPMRVIAHDPHRVIIAKPA
ncbi:4-amino-4-deoxy-L-arabinose transferase [Mycoavidus cysteinexigens]|uniref:4-amino-4-deoxy-L-arabinose transferase n=1 Tax=Mycoavidus cysteinexigens TaxID=1553431 RepID=A0A2Z6ET83_9BURK|nr:glycosyltransferase family 39 protein [Mycoavidus cysteinexigens]BBE08633.1 4-amino-4-deoxy-L-arabinose transferase [Mycoavidus cysteinexigens]GAM52662.1 polymyxin resistance protein ArnT, undecaprenyl phosphate-alpha-L-Ara4N transferase [bacterium endosymbiont of Mortierella elongata FMR23-6]GLR01503.1 4-amino-4-deoxy-L-arabinose transferase [Mycoavidus cysteinexigens]